MDLFNNPMVDSAKKALTEEQMEEYKKIGEYMYNNVDYKNAEIGSKVKEANDDDLIVYASMALKSGADPHDLTQDELAALIRVYGNEWYKNFHLRKEQVPVPKMQITSDDILNDVSKKIGTMKMCRQQRRMLERKLEKEKNKKK